MFIKEAFAANSQSLGGFFEGLGPLGKITDIGGATGMFNKVISITIGLITLVAGIWFTFQILLAGFSWMTAAGDKVKAEKAQKTLTDAIIGLVVVVAAVFIADIIGKLLGINILSPGTIFQTFWK